ncbi:hypothetical protein QYE76_067950 [Lolium multiflorum]|uniref:Transposase (putative) gypsy type domain-containing protein n=1 Tax=Lolium multiflorum TaxID=4521 RepID=A0AAD8SFU0_LOLMU|nr:hypothetical protein QYE76_067950 [Lolium multiflorum]
MESPSRITDCLNYGTISCRARQGSAFHIRRTGSGFLMGLHGSGFLRRSVRIRLSDPGPDFILHDQQQLGRPMGLMPPSPSMGHPGLPDLGTVDDSNGSANSGAIFARFVRAASSSFSACGTAGASSELLRRRIEFILFLTSASLRGNPRRRRLDRRRSHYDVFHDSASYRRADHGDAPFLRSASFVSVQLDPTKDSGKDTEGTSAVPEKTSEAEKKAEEIAAKKSKARQRDSESRGLWAPPHNISPNSVLAISNHVTLCEGHLRVTPELSLFQYYFTVKKERIRQSSELATCGTITFMIRPGRVYPHTDRHESARYWSGGFFYLKDVSDPANVRKLATIQELPRHELPTWSHCPHLSESLHLTRAVRRICKLTEEGLTGKDLTLSWFTKRIQPLQHGIA